MSDGTSGAAASWMAEHRSVLIYWAVFLVAGVVTAVVILGPEWGMARSVLAGIVGGAGSALILTANRVLS